MRRAALLLPLAFLAACGTTATTPQATTVAPTTTDPSPWTSAVAMPPTTAKSFPAPFFFNGIYVVGTDIEPGTYHTPGSSTDTGECYWARLKDTTGDSGSIIANGSSQGQMTLTIKSTDAAVKSSGCSGWAKVP